MYFYGYDTTRRASLFDFNGINKIYEVLETWNGDILVFHTLSDDPQ